VEGPRLRHITFLPSSARPPDRNEVLRAGEGCSLSRLEGFYAENSSRDEKAEGGMEEEEETATLADILERPRWIEEEGESERLR